MRKRKFYLTEFLKKNKNRHNASLSIVFQKGQSKRYETFTKALIEIEDYEKQNHHTIEIVEWYYNDYLDYVVFIK